MASVYRKTVTRPLPAGAVIFKQNGKSFARWGKKTAPVNKSGRIVVQALTYTAKVNGREVSTG